MPFHHYGFTPCLKLLPVLNSPRNTWLGWAVLPGIMPPQPCFQIRSLSNVEATCTRWLQNVCKEHLSIIWCANPEKWKIFDFSHFSRILEFTTKSPILVNSGPDCACLPTGRLHPEKSNSMSNGFSGPKPGVSSAWRDYTPKTIISN